MRRPSLVPETLVFVSSLVLLQAVGWIPLEAAMGGVTVCLGFAAASLVRSDLAKGRNAATDPQPPEADSRPAEPDPDFVGGRVPFPVLLLGRDGAVRYANPSARSLFGGVSTGQHVSAAIRVPEFSEALTAVCRSGDWREIECGLGRDPERRFAAWIRTAPGSGADAGDGDDSVLVCLEDRTQYHRAQALHRDFVANASHELRTPLATVAGCIETLQGHARDDPEATRRFTAVMRRETDRMRRIVSDLLSLNGIEMQEHVRPTDRVDMVSVAREALASRPSAAGEDTVVELPDEACVVYGARIELLHALDNVLANAELHAGGATALVVRRVGSRVEVAVEDRGPGVAREDVPRLTERFYRVDVPDSRRRGGTGLGLAIVKHVVSRHKGELRIESEPGVGSRFVLEFELAEDESSATPGQPEAPGFAP